MRSRILIDALHCMKKAIVAVARKLTTMLLAMWKSGTAFWATRQDPASAKDFARA